MSGGLRRKVVIAEYAFVARVISIVFRKETLLAQEVIGFQDEGLPNLQGEDVLVGVRGDDPSGDRLVLSQHLVAWLRLENCLQPLCASQLTLLLFGHISQHS